MEKKPAGGVHQAAASGQRLPLAERMEEELAHFRHDPQRRALLSPPSNSSGGMGISYSHHSECERAGCGAEEAGRGEAGAKFSFFFFSGSLLRREPKERRRKTMDGSPPPRPGPRLPRSPARHLDHGQVNSLAAQSGSREARKVLKGAWRRAR